MKKICNMTISTVTFLVVAYLIFTTVLYGPDSIHSRNGFTRLVGIVPPSVSKIYYDYDDLWLDPYYKLRFVTSDYNVVEELVKTKQLQECKEQKYIDDSGPEWWTEKDSSSNLKCFCREIPQDFWYLWYDPVTGTVWYEEFST